MPLSLNTQWPGSRHTPGYYRIPADTPTEDVDSRRGSWGRCEKGWSAHHRENSFGGRFDDDSRGRSIWQVIFAIIKGLEHIALLSLLLLLFLANTRPITVNMDRCHTQPSPRTTKSFVPNFPTQPTMFTSHPEFGLQHQRSHPSNDSWAPLSPKDDGWILIPNPSQYNLSSDTPFPNTYMISAFHSLHCLEALQGGFLLLQDGKEINEKHIDHCLDYVRQSLTCKPDLTLESAERDAKTGKHVTRGIGQVHECVDFERLVEWVDGHGDGSGSGKGANEMGFRES